MCKYSLSLAYTNCTYKHVRIHDHGAKIELKRAENN